MNSDSYLDWFSFRKPSISGQKLLDEIDDEYDNKLQRDRMRLSKYRRLGHALLNSDLNDKSSRTNEDISASDHEYALPPVFGRSSNSLIKSSRRNIGTSNDLGELKMSHKEGGTVLDGAGIDEDAAAEYNEWTGGDYEKVFADDDEEHIIIQQNVLEEQEDHVAEQTIAAEPEAKVDKDGRVIGITEDSEEDSEDGMYYDDDNEQDEKMDNQTNLIDEDMARVSLFFVSLKYFKIVIIKL